MNAANEHAEATILEPSDYKVRNFKIAYLYIKSHITEFMGGGGGGNFRCNSPVVTGKLTLKDNSQHDFQKFDRHTHLAGEHANFNKD